MVNECLDFIKLTKSLVYLEEVSVPYEAYEETENFTGIDAQALLDQLPESYRTVFNLFVLEEYSHKEIAQLLSISESNSKSILLRAKNKLKELILQEKDVANEN